RRALAATPAPVLHRPGRGARGAAGPGGPPAPHPRRRLTVWRERAGTTDSPPAVGQSVPDQDACRGEGGEPPPAPPNPINSNAMHRLTERVGCRFSGTAVSTTQSVARPRWRSAAEG